MGFAKYKMDVEIFRDKGNPDIWRVETNAIGDADWQATLFIGSDARTRAIIHAQSSPYYAAVEYKPGPNDLPPTEFEQFILNAVRSREPVGPEPHLTKI